MIRENLINPCAELATEFRQLPLRDKITMAGIGLGVMLVGFVLPVAGVVKASYEANVRYNELTRSCQPPMVIDRMSQKSIETVLAELVDMRMPVRVYLTDGSYRSKLSQQVHQLREDYNAKISIKDRDPNRSLTEGSVIADESGRCEVILYYP